MLRSAAAAVARLANASAVPVANASMALLALWNPADWAVLRCVAKSLYAVVKSSLNSCQVWLAAGLRRHSRQASGNIPVRNSNE